MAWDFWDGLATMAKNFFSTAGSSIPGSVYNAGDIGGFMDDTAGQMLNTGASNGSSGWSSIGREVAKPIAAGLGQLGVAAASQAMMPGTRGKVVGLDVRSDNMKAAEGQRMATAGTAGQELTKALGSPTYGTLSREMQDADMNRIKKQTRSADAARGMLETGGSAAREREALRGYGRDREKEHVGAINDRFSQVNSLTQGLTPQTALSVPAQENPWAKILTSAMAPAVGKGIEKSLDKWWV